MELAITTAAGAKGKETIAVSDVAFAQKFNESLVHQMVVAYQANGRMGTKTQKTRSEVRGGGAKPWKQKGTGRARAGTSRSPIWRSGGVTFAAKPRDYSQKLNKKMYRAGLRSILSELVRQDRLIIVNKLEVKTPKTRDFIAQLKKLSLDNVLVVTKEVTENLYLAARNIPHVDVRDVSNTDPVSLIGYERVLMTVDAVKQFEERLA